MANHAALNTVPGQICITKRKLYLDGEDLDTGAVLLCVGYDPVRNNMTMCFEGRVLNQRNPWSFFDDFRTVESTKKDVVKGKNFVITGKLEHERKYYEALIELYGGKLCSSVSKTTDFLIIADIHSTSSKATSARANGTPLLTESAFLKMIS